MKRYSIGLYISIILPCLLSLLGMDSYGFRCNCTIPSQFHIASHCNSAPRGAAKQAAACTSSYPLSLRPPHSAGNTRCKAWNSAAPDANTAPAVMAPVAIDVATEPAAPGTSSSKTSSHHHIGRRNRHN